MNKEIDTSEILSELERDKVVQFNEDKIMTQAVKKVLLHAVYNSGVLRQGGDVDPTQNFVLGLANNQTLTNEVLGQEVRAAYWGVATVKQGFDKLLEIKREVTILEANEIPQ
jgi:hypothetical protein